MRRTFLLSTLLVLLGCTEGQQPPAPAVENPAAEDSMTVTRVRNPVSPGNWFPEFTYTYGEETYTLENPDSVTAEDRRRDEFIMRLVEADCPDTYPFSGTGFHGEQVDEGDEVHFRAMEWCMSRQVETLELEVSGLLDELYRRARQEEAIATGPLDSIITKSLIAFQTAWLNNRDALCEYKTAQYLGGTGSGYAWTLCDLTELKKHRDWITAEFAYYDALNGVASLD